jgi:two-component system, chemotaxis family, chemotaxis protein CheY
MPLVDQNNLPAAQAEPAALRVLIVDDQVVARGAVRSALDRLDRPLLVIEADNGEEALAIMNSTRVDIIFCDIQLPGISGPEALVHAYGEKEQRPFMVLMSTMQSEAVREIGRKVGVYEFLAKPFKSSDVINAILAHDQLKKVARTLLIDDSATARKLMARILAKSQFYIALHEAGNGEEALTKARATKFDVIFCDFNMPGIDGVETAGSLLRLNPDAQIVLISTEQQSRMIRSAQFVGAFAFLKKPFNASDVDAVLHDAFAIKRPSLARPTHAIFSNEDAVRAKVDRANGEPGVSGPPHQFGAAGIA